MRLGVSCFVLVLGTVTCVMSAQSAHDGYVGSKACSGCHAERYQSFQKTGMGRSMSLASDWKPDRLPGKASIAKPGSSRTFAVSHNGSAWIESESEPGVFSVEHQLDYVVGSGANGLTFLTRRGDFLFQAPLSYYSKPGQWDFSPGYERVDLGFGRVVPEECIDCHAGRPAPIQNRPGAYAASAFPELAIGCENCHGPGEAHVGSLGKKTGTIVNPAKLAPRLAENICLNCHQGGDVRVPQPGKTFLDFRPGEWLFDTAVILKQPVELAEQQESDLLEHNSAMQASRCFRESAGKLGCLTCHDPHAQPRAEDTARYYRAKCLTCHKDQSCTLPVKVRFAQTPSDNCVGCHMPKRKVLQISHSALTNHRIPARDGEPGLPIAQQDTDGLRIMNAPAGRPIEIPKVTLLRAYQELAPGNPGYQTRYMELLEELSRTQPQNTFVQAAQGHKAFAEGDTAAATPHLEAALPLGYSAICLELAQSLIKLGRTGEAMERLSKGIESDPYDASLQKELIVQYINAKSYGEARLRMEQYVATFPEDSFMRNMLARVRK